MLSELTAALRAARRNPGFFLLATLTVGLGIAANCALFSLLDGIYFRPLPLREPDRLLVIESTSPKAFGGLISYPEYEEISKACPAFEDVVAVGSRGATLRQNGEPHLLLIDYVSDNFFEAMGIPIHLGRSFRGQTAAGVETPQVIINHELWQDRLGGRGDIIGSAIQLNDTLFTVVGVTSPGFVGLKRIVRTDVWVTTSQAPFVVSRLRKEVADRYRRWFNVYGRLAPGALEERARAQLDVIARRWEEDDPQHYPRSGLHMTSVDDAHEKAIRQGAVFLALPGLVLLIACANVANLLLARSEARRREFALRAALGARRGRVLQQLLAESLVLASFGTAAGWLMAVWIIQLFPALVPPGAITYILDARFDGRTVAFSAVLAAICTILVAAAPALRVILRSDVVADLKTEAAGQRSTPLRFHAQHFIVGAQMAIGVVVLVAAALMARSLWHSVHLRPGFDTEKQVASFLLVPGLQGYSPEATYHFFEEARRRLEALPSVRRASYAIRLPAQDNEAGWAADFVIPGKEPPPGEEAFRIRYTMVGPDYFQVMGTRILRGRGIRGIDRPDSQPVAIIGETMAKRLWPGEDPLGETIFMGKTQPVARQIVGIAEDIKISNLYEDAEMYVYVPYAQNQQGFGLLLVEVERDVETILDATRAQIARVDPGVPVLETGSFDQHMKTVLYEERLDAWIAAAVGMLALALTAVGVYGLVTMVTSYRTREIGIRIVLGAANKDVVYLVLNRGVAPIVGGCGAGVVGGLVAAKYLGSRIHGIGTYDPLSFVLGAGLLTLGGLLAGLVPAWRASRLDPAVTMRYE